MTLFLLRCYAALLRLYPREFREEFADEMRRVLADALADADKRGSAALIAIYMRELLDLPGAILGEHRRGRRNGMMKSQVQVAWPDILVPAIPILLYLATPIGEELQSWIGRAVWLSVIARIAVLIALVVVLIAGIGKGMPRWSLPAVGLFLGVLNWILFSLVYPDFSPLFASAPLLIRRIVEAGFIYWGNIVLTLVVLLVTAIGKPWRPFFDRLRQDWTLLPFALYGIMPLFMLISFDEYLGDAPFQIAMAVIWVTGLWLYLRSAQPGRKLLILAAAIALAVAVEVAGKWMLVPYQTSPQWQNWHSLAEVTMIEVTGTIYQGFWLMVIVFLPALLGLLPRRTELDALR